MDGYSPMEEYSEGYPARPTATPVSSANSSRNTTEIPAGHVPRHHHESSGSGRPVMSGTSSAASYSAGNITVPDYRGSGTLGYAAHLSDVPTSGYATEPARFSHHLPPTSSVSAYEPRSYAFHPGGYPLQPRQELSYGQLSHSYIGQSQQSSLRTDSETYNAALALVQSQSKMFSDASGGQFYQLDSGAANSSSYEVVHSNLVDNSSQNVSLGPDRDHGGKVIYVSEKPQTQMSQDSDTVVDRDSKALSSVKDGSEGQVEVVVETIELVDATSKSDTLQGDTLVLLKADNAAEQSLSQVSANNPLSDTSSEAMTTQETPIDKQMYVDENQENATKTLNKIDKAYKDTASQVDGPVLESRFGILEEELKEFRGSKACCIKLKPVKKSYLDVSCNNIVFDIEIDNDLIVSSIEKAYLTEKTWNYSFKITAHKDYYPKSTSQTVEKDGVSITVNPTKATSDLELLTENPTHKLVKEPPEIKIEKEEPPEKIMTRASKRKMAKPLKKTVLKQPHVGKSKDTQSSVEVKVSTKHEKTSKISKKVKGSKSSKKAKESKSPKKEKESISPKKEKESKKKKSKSKSKSSKEPIQTDTDLEEAADRSDDYNSAAETTAVMEVDNEKLLADTDIDAVEVKSEITDEIKTDEQNNVAAGDSGEKVIIKQKKKRKKETEEKGDGKPKRVYQKRKTFSQTELNYSVRKSENGKMYVCNICGYESKQTGNMRSHMRCRHTEEKPFQCQYCPKSFSSQSNLRGHWSIHKDERPYLCSICGTAFKANSNLVKHTQRHLGDKRFSCTTCGKQFVTSTDLRRHFRVHSSEKSFLCELCPKSFKDATSLYRHAVCHTGEKNFLCTFCGDAFARKDNCYTHMKKHHTHETDLLPPPQRRLENYVHNSDQSEPEETAQASSFDHKPGEHKPVIPPLVIEPLSPIADQHKAAFCAPPVMTEVYLDNQHQAEAVMESQIPVAPMDKVPEGTYTQLMAVDDISSLNACKMPSQQQPYEMYIPMSMHGPSW